MEVLCISRVVEGRLVVVIEADPVLADESRYRLAGLWACTVNDTVIKLSTTRVGGEEEVDEKNGGGDDLS